LSKIFKKEEIMKQFSDGQTIMIAGFAGTGEPIELTDMLLESGVKNLTIISNDTGYAGEGVGRLFESGQGIKLVCSYIGMDPGALAMVDRKVSSGELELDLNPQGTLCERIRSGGAGLGGVLTQTGIGTVVEKGKQKIEVDGKTYLLETALHADIALIRAWKADTIGNLIYRGTSRTYNPVMATAADIVIVIVDEIVSVGTFDPEIVVTPGVFVNMIIKK
jgi:acetate CoA/acetoacetate CoA-transferase alpha subunit